MNIKDYIVECQTRKFRCVEYEFNYESDTNDKKLLNNLINKGEILAQHVNPTLARDASKNRSYEQVRRNCIAGVIAEYCWIDWLSSKSTEISIYSKKFKSADKQIDIFIIYPDNSERTIEVRSSFPYKGLKFAVCKGFDIIGWYTNPVKTMEIKKDYYVRVLYPFHEKKFLNKMLLDSFSVFLTGGASRKLLETSPYSKDKTLTPYDDIDAMRSSQKAVYRVIEPIVNANDTCEITEHILNQTM